MHETEIAPPLAAADTRRWWKLVSGYEWLVLAVASAGWIFDNYENQIFNITRDDLLGELLKGSSRGVTFWGEVLLGVFLVGGATGGILFGWLADRWGRSLSMILTILVYAAFSGLTYFAQSLWQVAALRFLVALGTGGEWAVAAALVAEVFPARARAYGSAIFHASSVLGVACAAVAGIVVGSHWRHAYLIGILPAILVLAVRAWIREPEQWQRASTGVVRDPQPLDVPSDSPAPLPPAHPARPLGSFEELWKNPIYRKRAFIGLLLAAVGLAGYWTVLIEGQHLSENLLIAAGTPKPEAARRAKFAFGIIQNIGGGLGLLAMGPLCATIGRRRAFIFFFLAALLSTPMICWLPRTYTQMLILLPIFGFFQLGVHAGYAIYFPELFPTRLRATGSGLCFNGARIVAAVTMPLSGWLKSLPHMDLRLAVTILGSIYALGVFLVLMLPETKGRPLEE